MTPRIGPFTMACCSTLFIFPCLSGCATGGSRNRSELVLVETKSPPARSNVRFVLELKQSRKEVPLGDLDAFLDGDQGTRLSSRVRRTIARKRRHVEQTLAGAQRQSTHDVILTKPRPEHPFANDNIVAYVQGKSGYHVFDSIAEVDQLFTLRNMEADLATLHFTHAYFEPTVLDHLKTAVEAEGLELRSANPTPHEARQLRVQTAAGVLERALRDQGVALKNSLTLLRSGSFEKTWSPKLADAFQCKGTVEKVLQNGNSDVIRALVYLTDQDVIDLAWP